ncbi:SRR1-like protein [Spea bombifrons]|uniref:SRR1-like protein n=1 Tax=Spea bombifrons TaxID=233779 RepID=UPI00234AA773|nr:SRR1-like protein [Spea bombifrons]
MTMEQAEWQVVRKKKSTKNQKVNPKEQTVLKTEIYLCDTVQERKNVIQKLYSTMEDLRLSEFWKTCQECVQRVPPLASEEYDSNRGVVCSLSPDIIQEGVIQSFDCVCYGLGNFSSCIISRHQLAFLLLFLEQFKIPRSQSYVFDPLFSQMEVSVLQQLGLTVLLDNEEGKRVVHKPTVFYMLHCGKALYNNLLWCNWSQEALSNMIIIGNSFKSIEERLLSRILQRDYMYIHQGLQIVEETPFPESCQYNDVFNDTSIHYFPMQKLRTLPADVWLLQEEPQYHECEDLEIIRNQKT